MKAYNEDDVRWFTRAAFAAGVVVGILAGGLMCWLGTVYPLVR